MAKREKKKTNNRRKLLLLILLLFVTVLLMSLSAYAWFTSNKTVSVDSLEVQARTTNGLEISADAVNWGISIDKSDIINTTEYGTRISQMPDVLDHVSTVGALHDDAGNNFIQMFDGHVATGCSTAIQPGETCSDPIYTLTATAASEMYCYDTIGAEQNDNSDKKCSTNNKTFMAFDIFLRYTGDEATRLYLTNNAGVKEKNQTDNFGIKNAVRIAFLKRGNISLDTYYAGDSGITAAQDLNANDPTKVYIWEPNYNTHTRAGRESGMTYFGLASDVFATGTYDSGAIEYYGVKAVIPEASPINLKNTTDLVNYGDFFQKVNPSIKSVYAHSEIDTGIDIEPGVTKYRVYFWVEGQDVDAENNATGHDMVLNLEFAIH